MVNTVSFPIKDKYPINLRVNQRYTYEEVRSIFDSKGFKLLETLYINNKTPLLCLCSCGNETRISLKRLLNGQRCRGCGYRFRKERTFDYSYVSEVFSENGCTLLETEYKDSNTHMRFVCTCGQVKSITFYRFKQGQRCRECGVSKYKGENHYKWNPSLTPEERVKNRDTQEDDVWSFRVKQRDNFTCRNCGDNRGGNLVSHHLEGYSSAVHLRHDKDNGITLCNRCHKSFHSEYGYGGNNSTQFKEWYFGKDAFRKIV